MSKTRWFYVYNSAVDGFFVLAWHKPELDGFDSHCQTSVHCSKQYCQLISATLREKFLGTPRIEPGATGCKAWTLSIVLSTIQFFRKCFDKILCLHQDSIVQLISYQGNKFLVAICISMIDHFATTIGSRWLLGNLPELTKTVTLAKLPRPSNPIECLLSCKWIFLTTK